MSYDDAVLRIERMADSFGISDTPCLKEDDPKAWHVQIFRSIDSNSVKGFPKDPMEATNKNLVCGKNMPIDMSIHTAFVKAIPSAQHFIYMENQYFIGFSFNWSAHKDLVRGMMYYRKALELQAFLDMAGDDDLMQGYKAIELNAVDQKKGERSLWARCQAVADMKFTYVVSCQQYGIQKRSAHLRAQDILRLMTVVLQVPVGHKVH